MVVDSRNQQVLVLDGGGSVVRQFQAQEWVLAVTGRLTNSPGTNLHGAVIYRDFASRNRNLSGPERFAVPADSAPLVRMDLSSHRLDTVTFIRLPSSTAHITKTTAAPSIRVEDVNPMPVIDDWAVLTDGAIAVLRGSDYTIDFFSGTPLRSDSHQLPYQWRFLSGREKDSVISATRRLAANRDSIAASAFVSSSGASGGVKSNLVRANDLSEKVPAFGQGSIVPDANGGLWVRTNLRDNSGSAVYHVVDRRGRLVERVALPLARRLVAVGRKDIYLAHRTKYGVFIEAVPRRTLAGPH
jgi:hypothetical protein